MNDLIEQLWLSFGLTKPNPDQTPEEFKAQLRLDHEVCGNAYIWKVKNKTNELTEVWRLEPYKVGFLYNKKSGEEYYTYQIESDKGVRFPVNEIERVIK